jgi:3-oxoadipate enol-lactonase
MMAVFSALTASACGPPPEPAEDPTEATEVESGFVDVPGGRLYFKAAGAGEPLVLIHGNAGDRRHWDDQFLTMSDHFRVIRYDVRGYGQSAPPDADTEYSNHGDLAVLLDALGIRSAHVVGWSMGSGVAFDFAIAHPERVRSVVSVGPWVNGFNSDAASSMFAEMGDVSMALRERGVEAGVRAWMETPFFATTIQDPDAGRRFEEIALDYSWFAFTSSSSQQNLRPSAASRLASVEAPVLIVTAEYDIPACVEIAALIDDQVASSQLIEMVGTGHLAHMERPDEFNSHVLAFLGTVANE